MTDESTLFSIKENYIGRMIDHMDLDTLCQFAYDRLLEDYREVSYEDLKDEIIHDYSQEEFDDKVDEVTYTIYKQLRNGGNNVYRRELET